MKTFFISLPQCNLTNKFLRIKVLSGIAILIVSLAAVAYSKVMYGGYPLQPPIAYADEDTSRQEEGQYDSCPILGLESLSYAVHLPHPTCDLYYICVHGVAVERPCANFTHWNPRNITCDWPGSAACVTGAAKYQPNAITLY